MNSGSIGLNWRSPISAPRSPARSPSHRRRGNGTAVEEDGDLVAQRSLAVDPHDDVPLVVRARRVGGGRAQGIVAEKGAARLGVVGDATQARVGGRAGREPAIE